MLTINARYQVTSQPIGQGGMGVVYKAYDIMTKRDVAVKTMRGSLNQEALELFSKEWMVLARVSHPNIVDILDTGEFEQDGEKKPFFVMPLLPGVTLEKLIDNSSSRLTTERVVGIIAQACRGLHAAHERGLIHRDIKPSNIFVMDDDTVKIIDFGVVHLAGADSVTGLKGTLQYMAPENIEMKGTSAAVDIFALGVVSYQALTGRKPFARKTESETVEAILRHIPPPVYELNPLVSQTLSRVIHKAMAKAPWHRFSTAREFGETLQKALNGQPIERFDREKIQPRIERARKTQMEGDYQFASEILAELEAEGHIDPEISVLRIQLDQAVRQKSIRQLLDGARIRLEEDEFPLALQKIQQVLQIDPENPDALALRKKIDKQSSERQIQTWFQLVEQHLHNQSFGQARQALEEILKLNASNSRARKMLGELDQREEEITRLHAEKEGLYQSALDSYQHGEISSALSKLERVLELHSQSPASALPDRSAQYQSFYNQVRTERDAARSTYAEGRRHLTDKNFGKALEVCGEFLKKSPGDRMFQALKLEIEEQQRQEQSAYIAEIGRRVEGEADLERRVNILKEAVEKYPEEAHFQQVLRLVRERRDLVNGILAKASQYEERGQFNEAIGQFDILRNIYPQYPGLEFETERLRRRRDEQVREESKARFVDQIDRHLSTGNYGRASDIVHAAIVEFPHDEELSGLKEMVQREVDRAGEAEEWLQRGQKLRADGNLAEGLEALRKAASLDARNPITRSALVGALVEGARTVLDSDWRAAEPLIEEALNIDGGHLLAKSLQGQVVDRKRQEAVSNCLSQVREMRANNDVAGALAKVDEALANYPNEARLLQARKTLQRLDEETVVVPAPVRRPEAQSPAVQPVQAPQAPSPAVAPGAATQILAAASAPATEPAVAEKRSQSASSPVEAGIPQSTAPEQLANSVSKPADPSALVETMDGSAAGAPKKVGNRRGPVLPFGKLVWGTLGAGIVLIAFAVILPFVKSPPPPPPVRDIVVDLQSNISDVAYKIDGKPAAAQPVRLPLGAHTIEASAPGYKSETKSITLSANSPKPYSVPFQLSPELIRLRLKLESPSNTGKVTLDDGQAEDLQDGQFVKEGISLSIDHKLMLQAGKESLTFSFRAEPAKVLTLSPPMEAKDLNALIISNFASSARLYASSKTLNATFNDQSPQTIPQEGLELSNLPENAEVTLEDGKNSRRLTIERSNAPSLEVLLLAADPQDANIQIQSTVPGATLFVDNKKFYVLKPGKPSSWIVLQPGTHVLRAEKEGYQPSAEQKVEVKKGDVITNLHAFELKPVVLTGSLVIEGATPQANVFIDNTPVGSTEADGSFKRAGISPGNHTLAFRKAEFEEKQVQKTFTAGQETHISGAESQLAPYATLAFNVSPSNATITYKRSDETQAHAVENGKTIKTPAGRYLVNATAENYTPQSEAITVESGKTVSITWTLTLRPKPSTTTTTQPARPQPYFEDQSVWTEQEGWWINKGAGISWLAARQGVFQFEYLRQKAKGGFLFIKKKPMVDWVVDEKDSNNRVEYSFNFNTLERHAIIDGKPDAKPGKKKLPSAAATVESYPIQIDISPERIVIKDAQGAVLDTYQRPDPSVPLGKFGFKGEVALKVDKK